MIDLTPPFFAVRGRPFQPHRRTDKSFLVPNREIAGNDYDLTINRYKELEHEAVKDEAPSEIFAWLAKLETEIANGRKELEEMLG